MFVLHKARYKWSSQAKLSSLTGCARAITQPWSPGSPPPSLWDRQEEKWAEINNQTAKFKVKRERGRHAEGEEWGVRRKQKDARDERGVKCKSFTWRTALLFLCSSPEKITNWSVHCAITSHHRLIDCLPHVLTLWVLRCTGHPSLSTTHGVRVFMCMPSHAWSLTGTYHTSASLGSSCRRRKKRQIVDFDKWWQHCLDGRCRDCDQVRVPGRLTHSVG